MLLDDLEARVEAERCGLAVMGTLRVLELAAELRLLDFPAAIAQLASDLISPASQLVQDMLSRDADRKSRCSACEACG